MPGHTIASMPELPDLEVVREVLAQRLDGLAITSAEVRRPIVVRNLVDGDVAERLTGQRFAAVGRRGKFLLLPLDDGATLVIHPMMAGRLRLGDPLSRHRTRDVLVLRLEDGSELRYNDTKTMGKVYLTDDTDQVPGFAALGPEPTDPELTLEVFLGRLAGRNREIKTVLTTQTFVAGIGSAYADEICWRARVYPYRRRKDLSDDEVVRLYEAMRSVLMEAIETLRERVGEAIHIEIRDFLAVHGKAGQPCPRCGSSISEVKRERRPTNFCRTCQPGLLIRG
jgi:formamidopyrimidine-DNA glycosylase